MLNYAEHSLSFLHINGLLSKYHLFYNFVFILCLLALANNHFSLKGHLSIYPHSVKQRTEKNCEKEVKLNITGSLSKISGG